MKLAMLVCMLLLSTHIYGAPLKVFQAVVTDKNVVDLVSKMEKKKMFLDEINDGAESATCQQCHKLKLKFVQRAADGVTITKKEKVSVTAYSKASQIDVVVD